MYIYLQIFAYYWIVGKKNNNNECRHADIDLLKKQFISKVLYLEENIISDHHPFLVTSEYKYYVNENVSRQFLKKKTTSLLMR